VIYLIALKDISQISRADIVSSFHFPSSYYKHLSPWNDTDKDRCSVHH